jgi:hypothetical protein
MHTHADGTRHHDHHDHDDDHHHGERGHGASVRPAPVVHNGVNHTVRGGPPVLDIGGDIGAMVALMDPADAGTELFLRSDDPDHQPPLHVHTGVWTRTHGDAAVTAAVFPELVAGRYVVLNDDGHPVRPVVIGGGELTEIDLRRSVTVLSGDTDTVTDRV